MINKLVKTNPEVWPVSKVLMELKMKSFVISPDFQRDYVWKEKSMRDELIKSLLLGYPLGVLTIWRNAENSSEVVDGLQRLTTIINFIDSDKGYKLSKDISKDIIDAYKPYLLQEAEMGDKAAKKIIANDRRGVTTLLTFEQLSPAMKSIFNSYPLSLNVISGANENQIRNYFRVVQNQEKLKAGEIIKSISDNWLNIELSSYKVNQSMEKLLFNNSRNDFTKFLITYQGIIENKLKLGTPDKAVLSYAENLKENVVISSSLKRLMDSLEKYNPQNNYTDRQFNKFSMKLLIGSTIWSEDLFESEESFTDLIQTIYWVSEKISMVNSLNKDRQSEIKRSPYFDEIDMLSRLSRSVQNKDDVKRGVMILKWFVNSKIANETRDNFKLRFKRQPSQDLINHKFPRNQIKNR